MATTGFMVLSAIAVIIFLKFFITYIKKLILTYSNFNPGFPLPFIGHSYVFFKVAKEDILAKLLSIVKPDPHNRKVVAFIGQHNIVFFYHPENVEEILSSNVLLSKSEEYVFLEPWLGTGLLLSTHEKWHQRRKLLTPAFHFRILDDARDVFNHQSDNLVEVLTEEMNEGNEATLDIFPYMCRCTLDIILETAMGRQLNIQFNKDSEYAKALQDIIHVVQQRQLLPWYKHDFLFSFSSLKKTYDESLKILHTFTKKVIQDKRQDLDKTDFVKKGPIAFLDSLMTVKLPDGSMLNDADIQEEVDTFMFEGHDTTACALSWTLFLLGNHPEIQEKAYAEQVEIFGNDQVSNVTLEQLSKMKYLEACIKEGLRLYPSVPIIGRRLEKDTTIDGLNMKKGSTAIVLVHHLHRNPTIWENPEEFKPERLLDLNRSRHPYAYVPFSAGPRNCIGQKFAMLEEKTVLSKILRKFKFQSLDKVKDVKPVIEIITRPHEGIRMKIFPRE